MGRTKQDFLEQTAKARAITLARATEKREAAEALRLEQGRELAAAEARAAGSAKRLRDWRAGVLVLPSYDEQRAQASAKAAVDGGHYMDVWVLKSRCDPAKPRLPAGNYAETAQALAASANVTPATATAPLDLSKSTALVDVYWQQKEPSLVAAALTCLSNAIGVATLVMAYFFCWTIVVSSTAYAQLPLGAQRALPHFFERQETLRITTEGDSSTKHLLAALHTAEQKVGSRPPGRHVIYNPLLVPNSDTPSGFTRCLFSRNTNVSAQPLKCPTSGLFMCLWPVLWLLCAKVFTLLVSGVVAWSWQLGMLWAPAFPQRDRCTIGIGMDLTIVGPSSNGARCDQDERRAPATIFKDQGRHENDENDDFEAAAAGAAVQPDQKRRALSEVTNVQPHAAAAASRPKRRAAAAANSFCPEC